MTTATTTLGRSLALALLVVTAVGPLAANNQVPGAPQDHPILLRGGDLFTVSGDVLAGTDLLFDDGRIVAIGTDLDLPEGTEILDVSGQRVYPGIIAPNTQLGLIEVSAVRASNDMAETASEVTPEVAAHTAFNYDSEILPTIRNHGITTAQVVPRSNLVRGRPFITHLDGWTAEDAGVEWFDGLAISWPSPPDDDEDEEAREERRRLRQVFADAAAYRSAVEAGASIDVDQRWQAMLPVLSGEQNLYVAADDYREIVEAVAFARELGLAMVLVGGRDAHLAADLLAREEIPILLRHSQDNPTRRDQGYDIPYRRAALLHEAGVRFAFSVSGAAGVRNLPFQAGQSVAFGLPTDVAVRSLTLTPAEILGIDDRQGSLEVGKAATLFVSRGDVLDAITQDVTLMFIDGRAVDLDDKQRELDRKYRTKLERRQGE